MKALPSNETLIPIILATAILISGLFVVAATVGYWLLLLGASQFRGRHLKQEPPERSTQTLPEISLVVPAFNEAQRIVQKLDELSHLDYPEPLIEIIVVDDGSTDGTLAEAQTYQKKNPERRISVIGNPHGGPAAALCAGSRLATGTLIVWTDADATVTPTCLKDSNKYFEDPQIGAVFGRIITTGSKSSVARRRWELKIGDSLRLLESELGSPYFSNANFIEFRATLATEMRPDILNYDSFLATRAFAHGLRTKYAPEIVAFHPDPRTLSTYLRRRRRIFVGLLQLTHIEFPHIFRKGKFLQRIIAFRSFVLYPCLPLAVSICVTSILALSLLFAPFLVVLVGSMAALWALVLRRRTKSSTTISIWVESGRELLGHLWSVTAYLTFLLQQIRGQSFSYSSGREMRDGS